MKLRLYSVLACLCVWAATAAAQLPTPAQAPDVSAPKATDASPQVPSGAPRPPREVASRVNDGMGISVEPIFWKARTFPEVRAGAAYFHIDPGNLKYPSAPERAVGGRVNIPIGTNGTLRGSFIQMKSVGATTSPVDLVLFGKAAKKDDILIAAYKIELFKISYDYLTYFWRKKNSDIRLKTLWEVQRVSISNTIDDLVPSADGTTVVPTTAQGTKSILAPTFGLGLEQNVSRHFRWEVKASGWAMPHRSVIGDLEADVAFRYNHFELLAGGKYFHYKTSPQGEQYIKGTIYGPTVSLRYYFKKQ